MEPVRAERRGGLVEHDGRRVEGGTRSAVPAISFEGGETVRTLRWQT